MCLRRYRRFKNSFPVHFHTLSGAKAGYGPTVLTNFSETLAGMVRETTKVCDVHVFHWSMFVTLALDSCVQAAGAERRAGPAAKRLRNAASLAFSSCCPPAEEGRRNGLWCVYAAEKNLQYSTLVCYCSS